MNNEDKFILQSLIVAGISITIVTMCLMLIGLFTLF